MRPLRIYLENFMLHRQSDIDCSAFSSALIVAKNVLNETISNGQGKTSIFLAICYALFNKAPSTLDKIVRDGCDKAVVIFEFEASDGNIYSITRTRSNISNKSDIKLAQKFGDEWRVIPTRTIADAEAELYKIIKITHKAFINSVAFMQHDMSGLASASADKRKDILKEPLQLFMYSRLEKLEKERQSKTIAELDRLNNIISIIGTPETDLQLAQIELLATEAKINEKETEIFELRTKIATRKLELSEAERLSQLNTDRSNDRLIEIKSKKHLIDNNISQLKSQIFQSKKKIDELIQDRDTKTSAAGALQEKLTNMNSHSVRNIDVVNLEFDKITQQEHNGIKFIASDEQQLKTLNTPYPDGDLCTRCLQVISTTHREMCKQKLDEDIKLISERFKKSKETLLKIQKKKKDIDTELKGIVAHKAQIVSCEKDILSKKEIIASDNKLVATYNELKFKQEEELKKNEQDLILLVKEEMEIINSNSSNTILELKKKIISLNNEIVGFDKQISLSNKVFADAMGRKGALVEKIKSKEEAKSTLESLIEKQKTLQKKVLVQDNVIKAFGSKGIPSLVISTILDDLQIETNKLLDEFRPGLQVQIILEKEKDGKQEETLDIIYTIHGKPRDWEMISGGQKFYFAFSLKLGLSKVIQNRLGVNIQMLEFDEPERYCDKDGVNTLVELIKKLQSHYTIFLISHDEKLLNKFSHIIMVQGDEHNGSTAKLMTSF